MPSTFSSNTSIDENNSRRPFLFLGILLLCLAYVFFRYRNKLSWMLGTSSLLHTLQPSSMPLPTLSNAATSFIMPSEKTQKWLFAAGGIISAQNQEGFDQLKVTTPVEQVRTILQNGWGIHDRQSALRIIAWLKTKGHSAEFEQLREYLVADANNDDATYQKIKPDLLRNLRFGNTQNTRFLLDFTWQHKDDLANKGLNAWDNSRLINVSRWSYTAGYITEQEAWENMVYAGKQLQNHYHSWNEIADNYLLGRIFWQHSTDNSAVQNGLDWLKKNPASPWLTIPFDLSEVQESPDDIVEEDIMCKAQNCSVKDEVPKYHLANTLPNNFPQFLSVYNDSKISQIGGVTQYQIVGFTSANKDLGAEQSIRNFYKDQLQKNNWYLMASTSEGEIFSKGDNRILVSTRKQNDGTILFMIEFDK